MFLFIGISYLGYILLNYSLILREVFNGKYYFLHSSLVGINFILTTKSKNQAVNSKCLGDLVSKSEKTFYHVSRNPLNKYKNINYHGYI